MEVENKRLSEESFLKEREEVLKGWPTGKEVDLKEAISYHKQLPESKRMVTVLNKARRENRTLVQPRGGVALPEKHIELLQYLIEEGEADLLPTTIDNYTRLNQYEEAEKGIKESRDLGRSMLNGFPAVNHGVSVCRQIIEALELPLEVRHGTPDARLLAEITLAGGFTDFEGGGISYNIPYAKKISLEKTIYYWQYVDRLVGYYQEHGVEINREPFGPLTGTLVPPSISHSISIIEGLLAAEQGVANLSLGYGQNGNLIQDVAAIISLDELAGEYLNQNGYEDVQVTTVFHQWLGGFPQDEARAFAIISWGAVAAAMSKATKVIVKTPHEALGIPTREANAQGLKTTKQIINMLQDQTMEHVDNIEMEKTIIKKETEDILKKVLELGDGDWTRGSIKAFETGVLDIPFAPSIYNAGKTLPARDNNGAVRYLDTGNLPFSKEIKEYHQEKLTERGETEEREVGFQMVIDDIYSISKGLLVGRPR